VFQEYVESIDLFISIDRCRQCHPPNCSSLGRPELLSNGFLVQKKTVEQGSCPKGFWCKKSTNDEGEELEDASKCAPGFWCKRANKVIDRETAEGDCM